MNPSSRTDSQSETSTQDKTIKYNQPQLSPAQQLPPPVHQSDADEEDENVKQLGDCSALYLSLQDCLIKTNRNWKSCQMEVQALKACNERRSKRK